MPDSTPSPSFRQANGRFGPGNPGRRAGARGRVSHRVAMAILEDFELHKEEVLGLLRRSYTPAYFAVLLRLLDRQLQVDTPNYSDLTDTQAAGVVTLARTALASAENHREALLELDGVLLNQACEEAPVTVTATRYLR